MVATQPNMFHRKSLKAANEKKNNGTKIGFKDQLLAVGKNWQSVLAI